MNMAFSAPLSEEILPGSLLYIEVLAEDLNPVTADTISVSLINNNIPVSNSGSSIPVILVETDNNSGKFQGTAQLGSATNKTAAVLKAVYGDSITAHALTKDDTVYVTTPAAPVYLDNLRFMSSGFSSELTGDITSSITLYVEANGTDGNELTADTLEVYCSSPESSINITTVLTESGNNTGKYQGSFELKTYTDDSLDYLQAEDTGSIILIRAVNSLGGDTQEDTVTIQIPTSPASVTIIHFKTAGYASILTGEILPTAVLHIEASAVDLNANTSDTLLLYLINNNIPVSNSGCSIPVTLVETNSNSGIFQGTAQLGDATNKTQGILKAGYGNSITAYSTGKADTVFITTPSMPSTFSPGMPCAEPRW